MEPHRDGTHQLADGRMLRWAQWGVDDGVDVLFLHGTPASRLDHLDGEALVDAGVTLTTVDRPGVGGSSPQPGRRVIDWPADVAQLADGLGLTRFAVLAHSMGASYALACAVKLPDRVTRVGLLAPIGPWNEPAFAELVPPYVQPIRDAWEGDPDAAVAGYREQIAKMRQGILDDPDAVFDRFASRTLAATDLALFDRDPELRELVKANMVEHLAVGIEGLREERLAGHVMDWGFALADVAVDVDVFQGADDAMLPPDVSRELAARLPRATYHELERVGHFFPREHHPEILRTLLGTSSGAALTKHSGHSTM